MTPKELAKVLANPENAGWTLGELMARVQEVGKEADRIEVETVGGTSPDLIRYREIDACLQDLGLMRVFKDSVTHRIFVLPVYSAL